MCALLEQRCLSLLSVPFLTLTNTWNRFLGIIGIMKSNLKVSITLNAEAVCLTLWIRPLLVPRKTTAWPCTLSTETELRAGYSKRGMALRDLRRARGCCRWAAPQSSCSGCNWKNKWNEKEINPHQFFAQIRWQDSTAHNMSTAWLMSRRNQAVCDRSHHSGAARSSKLLCGHVSEYLKRDYNALQHS